MGLGRFGGGVGVTRFLASQGARVLVTDMLKEDALAESMAKLADLKVDYRLGGHDIADFTSADLIVVNPAVDRRRNGYLTAAQQVGVAMTSEIELAIERLPDRRHTLAVTGTAGKSTTTAVIGHVMRLALGEDRVHVGGNIGGSLLDRIATIRHDDWVVLELSSFMLEPESWTFAPHIAIVTNISDNHLDRHDSLASYAAAKQNLLRRQQSGDHVILGRSVAAWATLTPATCHVIDQPYEGELVVPGPHNRINAAMAAKACQLAGIPDQTIFQGLRDFPGLIHRLQLVCEHAGVRYYNDSKSTTPDSAMLGLAGFERGTAHVILGGYDKHADLSHLARQAALSAAAIYTIGQTGPAIADAAEAVQEHCAIYRASELEEAVKLAASNARSGQVVLLSPGCASWDQFDNYEARGRLFAELALRFNTEASRM